MNSSLKYLAVLFIISLMIPPLRAEKLRNVSLQLKWRHQFQFAGYYAAIEKGYYKEAGIHVTLLEAVEGRNPSDAVYDGKAEFGVCTSDILLMRSRQKKGVVLATIFQHSPQILLASKQSGIEHVQDLIGKRIALEPNAADIIVFMNDEGVSVNNCIIDQHKFNTDKLINGQIDAISAYSTDEPYFLKESNFDYTIISPSMGGIDFYGDLLFTTEALIKKNPVLVDNFLKASLKGWKYAMGHPQEIIELIYSKYSKRHSVGHLQFEAERMKHFIMADVVEPGYTNPGRWQSIAETYKKLKMLDPSFTTNGLLYSDYVKQGMKIPWKWISVLILIIVIVGFIAYFFYTLSVNLKNEIRIRRITEKDLHESELKYRAILAASPDNITITDLGGRILMVSPAGVKMFGGEVQEEFIGLNLSDFIAPVDLERAQSNIMLMSQGIIQGLGEYHGLLANGTIFNIEVNGEFIRDAGGQPMQMIFVVREIGDRKRVEEALRESEEKHRILFMNSPDAYLIIVDGVFVDCNRATEVMLHGDRLSIIGQTPDALSPEFQPDGSRSSEAAEHKIKDALNTGANSFEWLHRRFDGSEFIVEVTIAAMMLQGKHALFIAWRNISDRKQAEELLRESEDRYKSIFQNNYSIMLLIDPDTGAINDANPAACRYYGWSLAEMCKKNISEINTSSLSEISAEMQLAKEEKRSYFIFNHRLSNGVVREVEVYSNPIKFGHLTMLYSLIHDITERRQAEDEIKRNHERLLELNAEKDKFFSIIAHDLRGPFNGFLGLTKLMAEEMPDLKQVEIQKIARSMRDSATNLFGLLENLLEWALLQRGITPFEPGPFFLMPLITEIMHPAMDLADKKEIEIRYEIPNDLEVFADEYMLASTIRNLASNAVKFTTKGGKVTISAKSGPGNTVEFAVRDTGIGMSPQMVVGLFRLDVQTNRKGTEGEPSTGLGLILCKDFVEKHGGKIWVESEEGKGSCFYFTFPIND
jgi:PAS domain S-box-containing protein